MANLIDHEPIPRSPHRTLSDVRTRIDGYHFSKEALSSGERDILDLAEDLLSVIDAQLARAAEREDEAAASGLSEIQAPTDGDEVLGFELPPARTKENR